MTDNEIAKRLLTNSTMRKCVPLSKDGMCNGHFSDSSELEVVRMDDKEYIEFLSTHKEHIDYYEDGSIDNIYYTLDGFIDGEYNSYRKNGSWWKSSWWVKGKPIFSMKD